MDEPSDSETDPYIPPVVSSDPESQKNSDTLVNEEQRLIASHRPDRAGADLNTLPWRGLALSGGGIRSAIFCLGGLQALAAKDLLRHFDYMSSVSDGGYTASALQYWWSGRWQTEKTKDPINFGTGPKDFPYGTRHPDDDPTPIKQPSPQEQNLDFLRWHGRYLTPGDGITIWSGIAVVLRTLFLTLIVWIPLAALVFTIILTASGEQAAKLFSFLPNPLPSMLIDASWLPDPNLPDPKPRFTELRLPLVFAIAIWLSYALVAVGGLVSIALAMASRAPDAFISRWRTFLRTSYYLCLGIITIAAAMQFYYSFIYRRSVIGWYDGCAFYLLFMFGFVWLFRAVFIEWRRSSELHASYWIRRRFEEVIGWGLPPAILLFASELIPAAAYQLAVKAPQAGGFAGILSVLGGISSGLYGHYMQATKVVPGLAGRIFAPIGAAAFIYGALVASYLIAVIFETDAGAVTCSDILSSDICDNFMIKLLNGASADFGTKSVIAGAIGLGFALSWFTNLNQIGLHRFYRDRLMEAFMLAWRMVVPNRSGYAPEADIILLTDLWPQQTAPDGKSPRPYPFSIINTNAILVNDDDRKNSSRGGDSFILTPLFTASNATGWIRTRSHMRRYGPLSLASAMAASGAAANANSGY